MCADTWHPRRKGMNDRRKKTWTRRPREDVMATALHAMYIDMCDGCARAGLKPPTPEEWAEMLAAHLAELTHESEELRPDKNPDS